MAKHSDVRVAVIGAGPVGIAAGRALLRRGFTNLSIFEKASAPGGTWHQHSYPGLACDVKAHAYTFSGAPNPDWSANYVEQAEIEAYLQACATRFGLDPYLRLETEILRALYQGGGEWRLITAGGEEHTFDFVINAMGNQHTPILPEIEGIETFEGDSWHATEWNHDVDLAGKRVVLVGSAASAVQIVPEIAKVAGHLTVLQRTPNWILPRGCKPYSPAAKAAFRYLPFTHRALRTGLDLIMSLSHGASLLGHQTMERVEEMGRKNIASAISDEAMREALTPDSRFGCKRPLVSDDFYPALERDNVTLITSAAREVTPTGVVTADGDELAADVIIYCTGYKVLDLERIDVVGEDGRSLAEGMAKAPEAYAGIAVPGFPNYFLGVGPNGVLLSASFFIAMETNLEAIVRLLEEKETSGIKAIAVKKERHRAHNAWITEERGKYSWGAPDCHSYYHTPSGHTPFLFPGDLKTFKRSRKDVTLSDFVAE